MPNKTAPNNETPMQPALESCQSHFLPGNEENLCCRAHETAQAETEGSRFRAISVSIADSTNRVALEAQQKIDWCNNKISNWLARTEKAVSSGRDWYCQGCQGVKGAGGGGRGKSSLFCGVWIGKAGGEFSCFCCDKDIYLPLTTSSLSMQARHGRHVVTKQKKATKQLSQQEKLHALKLKAMQKKIDDRDKIIAVSSYLLQFDSLLGFFTHEYFFP